MVSSFPNHRRRRSCFRFLSSDGYLSIQLIISFFCLLSLATVIGSADANGSVYNNSASTPSPLTSSSDAKTCSGSGMLVCPNCGGIQVKDCQQCNGYLTTDLKHGSCINRQLFQPVVVTTITTTSYTTNDDEQDDNTSSSSSFTYSFLWNDIVATIFWFVGAGVAISCGIGGGGMFVPLGILLLQFAPKQASALSQCSIFGASLGGIALNLSRKHPDVKIEVHRGGGGGTEVKSSEVAVKEQYQNDQVHDEVEKSNSYYTRPLIDYDMVLFMAPTEMAGAFLGVIIQRLLPNWLYLMLAALVLFFTSYATYLKFWEVRRQENEKMKDAAAIEKAQSVLQVEHLQQEHSSSTEGSTISLSSKSSQHTLVWDKEDEEISADIRDLGGEDGQEIEAVIIGCLGACTGDINSIVGTDDGDSPETIALREQYLHEDMRHCPTEKLMALAVLWTVVFVLTLLIGGKGLPSIIGITCKSAWYWVLLAIQFLWLFGFACLFAYRLVRKQQRKEAVRYPFLPDDTLWNSRAVRKFGICTFLSGVVTGLIGISGGTVLNPIIMIMGVHPSVSSATTATMLVLTSSSVAIMLVISGMVPLTYAGWFFFACMSGAIVGKSQIDRYVRRTGRVSVLIFSLATIIALATVGCFYVIISRLAAANWCFEGFPQFCVASVEQSDQCPVNRLL